MKFHKLASVFPRMSEEDFESLKEDINENGQIEPIWLYEGEIIDGRHRYDACIDLGIEPKYKNYEYNDPVGFVLSINIHRRHLTTSQRAAIASDIADMPSGYRSDLVKQGTIVPKSRSEVAKELKVSEKSISRASKVKRESPEDHEKIKSGEKTINAAIKDLKNTGSDDDVPVIHKNDAANHTNEDLQNYDPRDDLILELKERISDLEIDNAVSFLPEDGQADAFAIIHQLKENLKKSEAMLKQATQKRDELQNENSSLKNQIKYLESQVKKLHKEVGGDPAKRLSN